VTKAGRVLWISWIALTVVSYLFFKVHPFWVYNLGAALFLGLVLSILITALYVAAKRPEVSETISIQDIVMLRFLEWRANEDKRP